MSFEQLIDQQWFLVELSAYLGLSGVLSLSSLSKSINKRWIPFRNENVLCRPLFVEQMSKTRLGWNQLAIILSIERSKPILSSLKLTELFSEASHAGHISLLTHLIKDSRLSYAVFEDGLFIAVKSHNVELLRFLMNAPPMKFIPFNPKLLIAACKARRIFQIPKVIPQNSTEEIDVLKIILEHKSTQHVPAELGLLLNHDDMKHVGKILIDSKKWKPDEKSLSMLVVLGMYDVVQTTLALPNYDPAISALTNLMRTCENDHSKYLLLIQMLDLFLSHPRLIGDRFAFEIPCRAGWFEVVEKLLAHKNWEKRRKNEWIDPAACEDLAMKNASRAGHVNVVRILLADPRVVFPIYADIIYEPLKEAILFLHSDVVALILAHKPPLAIKDDVSYVNALMRHPSSRRTQLFMLMLEDDRFKWESFLEMSCSSGSVAEVKILLGWKNRNGKKVTHKHFMRCVKDSKTDIMHLLMESNEIDPSENDNEALTFSLSNLRNANVELLRSDKRVRERLEASKNAGTKGGGFFANFWKSLTGNDV